ncbi:helix-turn-helix domain-containing protein [Herbiconiux sp. YIM B11900]|jgi:excisionase family DNA binding protein|uniref:helix-turn-helix domain-containing protein n=1 Tax=Herbiconiux sp. YIM B11900 TaxID=3404131 RepID=UPI003F82876F
MTDDDTYWDAFPNTLSTTDLSRILSVGRPGIFTRLTNGVIPAYRLERSWIIFKPEVRAWLDANSNRPQPEPVVPVDVLAGYADEMSHKDLMELFDKSKPTIYRWMELGVIPAFHVGGRWLVRKSQLRQALREVSNQKADPS